MVYANASSLVFSYAITAICVVQVLAAKGVCPSLGPSVPTGAAGPPVPAAMRDAEWFASAEDMAFVFSGLAEAALAKFGCAPALPAAAAFAMMAVSVGVWMGTAARLQLSVEVAWCT